MKSLMPVILLLTLGPWARAGGSEEFRKSRRYTGSEETFNYLKQIASVPIPRGPFTKLAQLRPGERWRMGEVRGLVAVEPTGTHWRWMFLLSREGKLESYHVWRGELDGPVQQPNGLAILQTEMARLANDKDHPLLRYNLFMNSDGRLQLEYVQERDGREVSDTSTLLTAEKENSYMQIDMSNQLTLVAPK